MYKFPTCTPTDNINRPYNPVCTSFRLVHQKSTLHRQYNLVCTSFRLVHQKKNKSIHKLRRNLYHTLNKNPIFICRDNALCLSKKLLTPSHREATLTTPCACPKNFSLVHFCKANPPVALCEPL